jgi:hypothetical protein
MFDIYYDLCVLRLNRQIWLTAMRRKKIALNASCDDPTIIPRQGFGIRLQVVVDFFEEAIRFWSIAAISLTASMSLTSSAATAPILQRPR